MKRPPKILKVYPSLIRNPAYPLQEFKVRIIEYPNSPKLLDIREFITSQDFTGYSPKGLSITYDQFKDLISHADSIMQEMERKEVTNIVNIVTEATNDGKEKSGDETLQT